MDNYLFLPKKMKMKMGCSILQTDEDVLTEVALHLPLQALFRCRAVCKLWRDVIDSPSFRKLHILTHSCSNKGKELDDDDKVFLLLNYGCFLGNGSDVKAQIKIVVRKGKLSNLNLIEFKEGFPSPRRLLQEKLSKFRTSAKGLICFNLSVWTSPQPLAICNPFLGQSRILPLSHIYSSSTCKPFYRDVGIGCDGEFYKVVELVYCGKHCRLHAHLYSSRTGSWRELGGGEGEGVFGQQMTILDPITVACNDGRFAHWHYRYYGLEHGILLTFDMKNEVFMTTSVLSDTDIYAYRIVAKDDGCSFILITFPPSMFGVESSDKLVRIYETCEEEEKGRSRKLSWKHVVTLEQPLLLTLAPSSLLRRDCVIVELLGADCNWKEKRMIFYNYRARRFVGYFKLRVTNDMLYFDGSFISP